MQRKIIAKLSNDGWMTTTTELSREPLAVHETCSVTTVKNLED